LKSAFVFHVSFENGTPLTREERNDPWNAIGIRMLHQLLDEPIQDIHSQYVADPGTVFQLVAAAENVDLYDDFTGILVIDGVQKAINSDDDRENEGSIFYGLLGQIAGLSLMSRSQRGPRKAPFIMTCVTATCFGPVKEFIADSHRNRVYLPINRLKTPTRKSDDSPIFDNSPVTRLLVNDVGGHARAIELIADKLREYTAEPNIAELANGVYEELSNRYREAVSVLLRHGLPVVQCVLSRQPIYLTDTIPGSNLRWEEITASGLIWFERAGTDYHYDAPGYLVVPYIWLWMLARLDPSGDTGHLCQFLKNWQFNDYAELLCLTTSEGYTNSTTWQNFEMFCCSFRILRSLGFKYGQEVPLKLLHSGFKLRDDKETVVVNRHLKFAQAVRQCDTDSKDTTTPVDTRHNGTLDAGAQLSHVIRNAPNAPAGDFFLSIKTSAQQSLNGKDSQGNIVREVGQCKFTGQKLTQDIYDAEREKSAGPNNIFMLYTDSEISGDFALPDRSGLVDASCWDSYFGPFAGRAHLAARYSSSRRCDKVIDVKAR
jgi:hypothetical protein